MLRSVHFLPGISIVVGGKHSALSFWDREKHPEIELVERNDGGVDLVTQDGRRRHVNRQAIAWTMTDPPPKLVKK